MTDFGQDINGMPLRLCAGGDQFGAAILARLQEFPEVRVTEAPSHEVSSPDVFGEHEAVLVPPHLAFRSPHLAVVPGVGVSASPGYAGASVYFAGGEADLEMLYHSDGEDDLALMFSMSCFARFGRAPVCAPWIPGQTLPDSRAGLVWTGGETLPLAFSGAALSRAGVAASWFEATGLPPVWRVWLCRHRAPFSRLRHLLGSVHRGLASLSFDPEFFDPEADAGELYYRLASLESDSLRRYLALLQASGACGAEAGLQYC